MGPAHRAFIEDLGTIGGKNAGIQLASIFPLWELKMNSMTILGGKE
jgi:hypothetical protein